MTRAPRDSNGGRRIAPAITARFDKHLGSLVRADRVPPTLYHYTTADGLVGIAQTRRIWASNVRYMNDPSEGLFAHYLQGFIASATGESSDEVRAVLLSALDLLTGPPSPTTFRVVDGRAVFSPPPPPDPDTEVFACCFTELPDLLSQWRAYSGGIGGYALGFRGDGLIKARAAGSRPGEVDSRPAHLYKVCYDAAQVWPRLRAFLGDVAMEIDHLGTRPHAPVASRRSAMARVLAACFAKLVIVVKDAAFSEEEEWRLTWAPMVSRSPSAARAASLHFRRRASLLVPYIELDFSEAFHPDVANFTEVVVGPNPEPVLAREAVQRLADVSGLRLSVRNSIVPLR